jgi:GGDEF domain-containing protein
LKGTVEPHGSAYRMGGDEFCVLFDRSQLGEDNLVQLSVAALCEHAPNFSITASHGSVMIPAEVADPASILQLADQRLYRRKEEAAARRSVYAYNGEDALALGEGDGGPLAGTAAEQSAGNRRVRRQPPL